MKSPNQIFQFAGWLLITGCSVYDLTSLEPNVLQDFYQVSLEAAVYPTQSKVDDGLFPINKENSALNWTTINDEEYVLMLSWKGNASYYQAPYVNEEGVYNTGSSYPIWVTAAPQLMMWANKETRLMKWVEDGDKSKVDHRLKQLLGLPPNPKYAYNYFVEFWVKPSDLFRPCPDPEIDDQSCMASFPDDVEPSYQEWINDTRNARFYNPRDVLNRYPWTALGYTYDWSPSNKMHRGMSEYVIKDNSDIYVKDIYTTLEYLGQ